MLFTDPAKNKESGISRAAPSIYDPLGWIKPSPNKNGEVILNLWGYYKNNARQKQRRTQGKTKIRNSLQSYFSKTLS